MRSISLFRLPQLQVMFSIQLGWAGALNQEKSERLDSQI